MYKMIQISYMVGLQSVCEGSGIINNFAEQSSKTIGLFWGCCRPFFTKWYIRAVFVNFEIVTMLPFCIVWEFNECYDGMDLYTLNVLNM